MDNNAYRSELDGLHYTKRGRAALADALMEAQAAGAGRETRRHFRWTKGAAAAALAAVLLVGTATAAVGLPRSLVDWFARQWEEDTGTVMDENHVLFIDKLTQVVGVSDTNGGVTVTLDSLTRGNSGVWLLLNVSGVEEGSRFRGMDLTFEPNPDSVETPGGYGLSEEFSGRTGDGVFRILLYYDITLIGEDSLLKGYEGTLRLEDLYQDQERIQEGEWELRFSLEPAEGDFLSLGSLQVPARDMDTREAGETELRNVQVSATDIRYTQIGAEQAMEPVGVSLVLRDGTEVTAGSGGARWTAEPADGGEWASVYSWRQPVDLTQAAALRWGDVEIPLETE